MILKSVPSAWIITDYGKVLVKLNLGGISFAKHVNGDARIVESIEKSVKNVEQTGHMIKRCIYGLEFVIEEKIIVFIWFNKLASLCVNIAKLGID